LHFCLFIPNSVIAESVTPSASLDWYLGVFLFCVYAPTFLPFLSVDGAKCHTLVITGSARDVF
jgi:hypothetical protein